MITEVVFIKSKLVNEVGGHLLQLIIREGLMNKSGSNHGHQHGSANKNTPNTHIPYTPKDSETTSYTKHPILPFPSFKR